MRHEQRPIKVTKHAADRMSEYRISAAEVETTIRSGSVRPDSDAATAKWIANSRITGREIEVVFVETERGVIEVLLVITVYPIE